MARRQKIDIAFNNRLDEFERRLILLKREYDKYFSGIEPIEPLRERDNLKRLLRDLNKIPVTNTAQKHRLRTLRARFSSMELFWQRNLLMIERGTHPKMKFRADLKERRRKKRGLDEDAPRKRRLTRDEKEQQAYQKVYDKYIDARKGCGQSTDMSYESIRDVLKKQVRTIKSRYRCKSVKFRVTVEDGKAKVKAVPLR